MVSSLFGCCSVKISLKVDGSYCLITTRVDDRFSTWSVLGDIRIWLREVGRDVITTATINSRSNSPMVWTFNKPSSIICKSGYLSIDVTSSLFLLVCISKMDFHKLIVDYTAS